MRGVAIGLAGCALALTLGACDALRQFALLFGTPSPPPEAQQSADPAAADLAATPAPTALPTAFECALDDCVAFEHDDEPPASPTPAPVVVTPAPKVVRAIEVFRGTDFVYEGSSYLTLVYTGATGSCLQLEGTTHYQDGARAGVEWVSIRPTVISVDASGKACLVDKPEGDLVAVPILALATGGGDATLSFTITVMATGSGEFGVR